MITVDTITDEQIRELREQLYREDQHPGVAVYRAISTALFDPSWGFGPRYLREQLMRERREARARCAEILNTRNAHREPDPGDLGWRCCRCLRVFAMDIDPGEILETFPIRLTCIDCTKTTKEPR